MFSYEVSFAGEKSSKPISVELQWDLSCEVFSLETGKCKPSQLVAGYTYKVHGSKLEGSVRGSTLQNPL